MYEIDKRCSLLQNILISKVEKFTEENKNLSQDFGAISCLSP